MIGDYTIDISKSNQSVHGILTFTVNIFRYWKNNPRHVTNTSFVWVVELLSLLLLIADRSLWRWYFAESLLNLFKRYVLCSLLFSVSWMSDKPNEIGMLINLFRKWSVSRAYTLIMNIWIQSAAYLCVKMVWQNWVKACGLEDEIRCSQRIFIPVFVYFFVFTFLTQRKSIIAPMKWKTAAAHLKGFSKKVRMSFSFLEYLFSLKTYWRFCILQIREVMTSWDLQLEWQNTEYTISLEI